GRVSIADVDFGLAATGTGQSQPADSATTTTPSADAPAAPEPSDALVADEALLLHVMKVRGYVTADGFVESVGIDCTSLLTPFVEAGMVRFIEKRGMYGLLPPGVERHQELLASIADERTRQGLAAHYEEFLALNDVFKQLCTDWQMRGAEPNDHSDAAYDEKCVQRLQELVEQTQPVLAGLSEALPRIARYGQRLQAAAARVAAGEINMFTGVMCGSFHDI